MGRERADIDTEGRFKLLIWEKIVMHVGKYKCKLESFKNGTMEIVVTHC